MILSYGGRDATDVFSGFHAASTWRELKHFHVGHLTVSRICCVLAAWEWLWASRMCSAGTCCMQEVLLLALCSLKVSALAWSIRWSSSCPVTSCRRCSQRLQHLGPEAWRGSYNPLLAHCR